MINTKMRSNALKMIILALFSTALVLTGCKKDDNTTTGTTTSTTSTGVNYTKVKFKTLVLQSINMTRDDGSGWDPSSGPDIFPQIKNGGILLGGGEEDRYSDVALSNFPLSWTLGITINDFDWGKKLEFNFWDYESLTTNEIISGVYFNGYDYKTNGYPTKIDISTSKLKGYILVEYEK